MPQQPDAKTKFAIDPHADQYKLVFATYFDGIFRKGKLYYVGAEYDRALPSINNSFIEQLNKAGQQGYKLKSVLRGPIAIVKLDEVPYEYAWFQTSGSLTAKGGFEGIYSRLAQQGFRLFANLIANRDCEDIYLVDSVPLTTCTSTDFFLLERPQGVEKRIEHRLVYTEPTWRLKMGDALTAKINERLAEGFFPTNALSRFEILVERGERNGGPSPDKPAVRVVTAGWRDNVAQKVNELAQQGYRLSLVNSQIAVMSRDQGDAAPVSYIWLDAKKKDFEKRLARLEAQGAAYRMAYPSAEGQQDKLIFEQRSVGDAVRREYKVLKFEFSYDEVAAEKKVRRDLTPSSKETINLLNGLVKEGFVVRDLFVSDGLSILLERSHKATTASAARRRTNRRTGSARNVFRNLSDRTEDQM